VKVQINTSYEKYKVSEFCHSYKDKQYTVVPVRIIRFPCGSVGAAKNRYYYMAEFIGFGDMRTCNDESAVGQIVRENIIRNINKSFNPKKLDFIDNVATI
tara:strand:- start:2941 stop:3240 length:300 start_codon:yes stop_codon:yes gene_type:complete